MNRIVSGQRRATGKQLLLVAAVLLFGCALPQKSERYHFSGSAGTEAVSADRYAGREANPFHRIGVRLESASPFQFRFPDGQWVHSREITRETLVKHGLINEKNRHDLYVAWHPDLPLSASVVGRHQYFSFELDKRGTPYQLSLGACGYAFDEILRTADGTRTYGFPLTVGQATELFGNPARIEIFDLVTGLTCF